MKDSRFTVTREFCGEPRPRWILRWCGEWVSKHRLKSEALAARKKGIETRRRLLLPS
jgi:hypothetical protein